MDQDDRLEKNKDFFQGKPNFKYQTITFKKES